MSDVLIRDPETMPLDCDMYILTQGSRNASSEVEEIFVRRVQEVISAHQRDYSDILNELRRAARYRGYLQKYTSKKKTYTGRLWQEIKYQISKDSFAAHRYCDIVCEAIRSCRIVKENVF